MKEDIRSGSHSRGTCRSRRSGQHQPLVSVTIIESAGMSRRRKGVTRTGEPHVSRLRGERDLAGTGDSSEQERKF